MGCFMAASHHIQPGSSLPEITTIITILHQTSGPSLSTSASHFGKGFLFHPIGKALETATETSPLLRFILLPRWAATSHAANLLENKAYWNVFLFKLNLNRIILLGSGKKVVLGVEGLSFEGGNLHLVWDVLAQEIIWVTKAGGEKPD